MQGRKTKPSRHNCCSTCYFFIACLHHIYNVSCQENIRNAKDNPSSPRIYTFITVESRDSCLCILQGFLLSEKRRENCYAEFKLRLLQRIKIIFMSDLRQNPLKMYIKNQYRIIRFEFYLLWSNSPGVFCIIFSKLLNISKVFLKFQYIKIWKVFVKFSIKKCLDEIHLHLFKYCSFERAFFGSFTTDGCMRFSTQSNLVTYAIGSVIK